MKTRDRSQVAADVPTARVFCLGLFWCYGCDGAHPSIVETRDTFMISILMEGFACYSAKSAKTSFATKHEPSKPVPEEPKQKTRVPAADVAKM
jgi:hypothetical protein